MAAWRRHALRLFPEIRDELDEDAFSPHALFFILLPFARDAHQRSDEDALERIYAFAQWCHHQRVGSELPNAVAVSFYEHLFDDWSMREDVVPWLSPRIRDDIWPLWQQRLDGPKLTQLRQLLNATAPARWRELRDAIATPDQGGEFPRSQPGNSGDR